MIRERYLAYAAAFEDSYDDDDWSRIAQYFTDDAVYEGDPEAQGNAAVLEKLKNAVDGFDRKMDSRTLSLEEPQVDGETLSVQWRVHYTKSGAPDLEIRGVETAVFEGDRISRLKDDFEPEAEATMMSWMNDHAGKL